MAAQPSRRRDRRAAGLRCRAQLGTQRHALMEVPFSRPYLSGREAEAVGEAIASRWVAQGPRVRDFEAAWAARVGAAEAVATANGTAALQLALHVCGVADGDEVIVPSLSFVATANAV